MDAPHANPAAYLEYLQQLERTERDERRGLETRATSMLVASVAAFGLAINAVADRGFGPITPIAMAVGIGLATAIGIGLTVAVALLLSALKTKSASIAGRPDRRDSMDAWLTHVAQKVKRIEASNHAMLAKLDNASIALGISLLALLAALIWLVSVSPDM